MMVPGPVYYQEGPTMQYRAGPPPPAYYNDSCAIERPDYSMQCRAPPQPQGDYYARGARHYDATYDQPLSPHEVHPGNYDRAMPPSHQFSHPGLVPVDERSSARHLESAHPIYAGLDSAMHSASACDQQPTYLGHIKSAQDAILLLAACDLPPNVTGSSSSHSPPIRYQTEPPPRRVTRRLLDAERADLVASGCVFVWDEKEAGMKRWTDGRVWSASRVSGCFLTYRELEARKRSSGSVLDGPTANQYKPDGLIKQSFSVTTTSGRKLHVISYFTKRDVREGRLRRVSEDPRFVGEGGGEWNLQVDEKEFAFPDGQQQHHGSTGSANPGQSTSDPMGDNGSNVSSDEQQEDAKISTNKLLHRHIQPQQRFAPSQAMPPPPAMLHRTSLKRALPDFSETAETSPMKAAQAAKPQRGLARPPMTRKRSSSMDSPLLSSLQSRSKSNKSSHDSYGSLDTPLTSASDTEGVSLQTKDQWLQSRLREMPSKASGSASGPTTKQLSKSGVKRDLVSPALLRESAVRGSATDMQASASQDSANAVGALLSLAGPSRKASIAPGNLLPSPHSSASSSPFPAAASVTMSDTLERGASPIDGSIAGVAMKPVPERLDSDRHALNMFNVRL